MSDVIMKIEGTDVVISELAKYNTEFRAELTKIVRSAANDVRTTGKSIAPNKTTPYSPKAKHYAKIRDSIGSRFTGGGNNDLKGIRATVGPGPKAYQRAFFVNGTKERYTKKGKYTGKMEAVHYMETAEGQHEARYNAQIKALVEKYKEL